MRKPPKPDRIVLVRTIDDPGTRLEIEPTMRRLVVEGVKYAKTQGIYYHFPDGHVGVAYVACVSAREFAPQLVPQESAS